MEIIAELVRRGHLVLWILLVSLLTLAGLPVVQKEHTPAYQARRSPAPRPWGIEARKVGQLGRRAYALRFQVVVVSLS